MILALSEWADMTPNTPLEHAQAEFSVIQKTLRQLDAVLAGDTECVSMEGFGSAMTATARFVADSVIRVIQSFKTIVLKGLKGLKRSEMREYSESNPTKIHSVENLSYGTLLKYMVYVPDRMKVEYLEAVGAVKALYDVVDIKGLCGIYKKDVSTMLTSARRGQPINIAGKLPQVESKHMGWETGLETITSQYQGKATDKTQFKKAYASMEDLRTTRKDLLKLEDSLQDAFSVGRKAEDISDKVTLLSDWIEENPEQFTKSDIEDLAKYVRLMAVSFEAHSLGIIKQMTLEHNHVLVLKNIYSDKV